MSFENGGRERIKRFLEGFIEGAGTWAASVKYLISGIAQLEVSQREMVEKYEVSEGTISTNMKRIADFSPKTKNDPFKEIPE